MANPRQHPIERAKRRETGRKLQEKINRESPLPKLPSKSVFESFTDLLVSKQKQRRERRNPPPEMKGAAHIGFKERNEI